MLMPLKPLVDEAADRPHAIPAFNVYGYEDAIAVVRAAEAMQAPVILAANLPAIRHMPLPYLAPLLLQAAREASVPVCVHLDHGASLESVQAAIDHGFTSVMFDGSQLPLEENIAVTRQVVRLARKAGVSVEAEVGSVGYSDPSLNMKHELSDPVEVERFVRETGVDAVAVSIGTVHRMEEQTASLRFDLLREIEQRVRTPLVIHGSTGVPNEDLRRLASHRVAKINIGTALRMAFGRSLREQMLADPHAFDRIAWFRQAMEAVRQTAIDKFHHLGWGADK
jgi:fructose-bisphosphate aldolase class II